MGKTKTDRRLPAYQQRLEALERDLRARVAQRAESVSQLDELATTSLANLLPHPCRVGDQVERQIGQSLLKTEKVMLAEVVEARQRIEQGRYGLCEECGRRIPRTRLDAVPYARHCIGCARHLQQIIPGT